VEFDDVVDGGVVEVEQGAELGAAMDDEVCGGEDDGGVALIGAGSTVEVWMLVAQDGLGGA